MTSSVPYVLGTGTDELERLDRQHRIWRNEAQASWARAGFGPGQRLLDLGCGPGFAALDLAELVGPGGSVLALDNAEPYLAHLRQQASARSLPQVTTLACDLHTEAASALLEPDCCDGIWCRWVAMFLHDPQPLFDLIVRALRPGGRLVLHEYIQWDTFALVPGGEAVGRFVQRCVAHWQANGGDPHIARRLPAALEGRGLRLLEARSLQACEPASGAKALWLQDFLRSYSPQLAAAGLWSANDQHQLEQELARSRQQASLWITPTLVELIWEQP